MFPPPPPPDASDLGQASGALITSNSGAAYVAECRAAGVPVPDTVVDPSNGWVNHGNLATTFIGSLADDNEIWSWESEPPAPPGVCVALPRWDGGGTKAKLFGVICMGTVTSRACFFDDSSTAPPLQRYMPHAISEFVGGVDLLTNGQGECTACHAGENPFVVHPEDPAFRGLVGSGVLRPADWYEPIIGSDPDWPHNPGPIALPSPPPGQSSCATSSCHTQTGIAGRFPDVTQLGLPVPDYCDSVLPTALPPSPRATMPPSGPDFGFLDPADFTGHANYLSVLCGAALPGGTVQEGTGPQDDPEFLSTPNLLPMYACTNVIGVEHMILGATVEIEGRDKATNTVVWSDTATVTDPYYMQFTVGVTLDTNQHWRVRQTGGGGSSNWSGFVDVDSHNEELIAFEPPVIEPSTIYNCSGVVGIRHLPGATLEVRVNSGTPDPALVGQATGQTGHTLSSPVMTNDTVQVRQRVCEGFGPWSDPLDVRQEPSPISAPSLSPGAIYDGQELVVYETNRAYGSTSTVSSSLGGSPPGFAPSPYSGRRVNLTFQLGRGVMTGEQLTLTQTLCPNNTSPSYVSAPVLSCAALPAPDITPPRGGEEQVAVRGVDVPGSRIRVRETVGAELELGDNSGGVVRLRRPLVTGETILVTRELAGCPASEHTSFVVN